ncbi:4226_t:CDS:2 [Ambispora gerdemannii]|uniref:4226_t:CDS:1 n=1 Tax=Ambispora gerdemannii TaxID=144530 RepID=A0A9N9G2Z1_9GLOM|nr:4226_t:CDS:2 [Ambispora gerdemannii]
MAASGRIAIVRTPGRKRLYSIIDIHRIFGDNQQTQFTQKAKICYARVSPEHQRDDLERPIENLRQHYPEYEIVNYIDSGLNWKRRGFVALLERIHAERIEKVVVTQKDRLCRFGSELVEWIFEKNGTRLMILGTDVSAENNEVGDLLSIVTVFVARHNGIRSAANRRRRREAAQAQEDQEFQEPSRQDTTYPSLSYTRRAVEIQIMDRDSTLDVQSMPYRSQKEGKSRGEYAFLHKIKSAEPLPNQLEYDSHLVVNRLGVIALDPGVRTFMTGYDPSGIAIEWRKNDISRIYQLSQIYDKIQSKHDSIHGKVREHPWCQVMVCIEEYTSKACGCCGHIHQKLDGSKVFHCPSYTTELDRDINGARNILLRYLTLLHPNQNQESVYAGAGTYPLGS